MSDDMTQPGGKKANYQAGEPVEACGGQLLRDCKTSVILVLGEEQEGPPQQTILAASKLFKRAGSEVSTKHATKRNQKALEDELQEHDCTLHGIGEKSKPRLAALAHTIEATL